MLRGITKKFQLGDVLRWVKTTYPKVQNLFTFCPLYFGNIGKKLFKNWQIFRFFFYLKTIISRRVIPSEYWAGGTHPPPTVVMPMIMLVCIATQPDCSTALVIISDVTTHCRISIEMCANGAQWFPSRAFLKFYDLICLDRENKFSTFWA